MGAILSTLLYMFEAKDIHIDLTVDSILNFVSEYDIFKKYCPNFIELDKSFKSEFYDDKNGSCRITQDNNNRLFYKDFGNIEQSFSSPFNYIMYKYNCTFQESLKIISNDFNLNKLSYNIKPNIILGREDNTIINKPKIKSTITILPRNWNLVDYNYWSKYNINFSILNDYNIIPCSNIYLHKQDKTIVFNSTKENPIYAYRFCNDGKYSYKIYKPLSPDKKYKWLFSGGVKENIEGEDQLPLFGDTLILTKSLKDIICIKMAGYPAISLQGEANKLEESLVSKMLKRFNRIIVLYDNDEQGIISSKSIVNKYRFKSIIIPLEYNCKDYSELVAKIGQKEAKIVLNKLINE